MDRRIRVPVFKTFSGMERQGVSLRVGRGSSLEKRGVPPVILCPPTLEILKFSSEGNKVSRG